MDRLRRFLSSLMLGIAGVIALCALAGSSTGHHSLQSWLPHTVTMKETTAWIILIHVLAGFLITLRERRILFVPVCIVALVTFLLAGGAANEIFRLENLASFDPKSSFYPSIVTITAGVLLAFKALAALIFRSSLPADVISAGVALIGAAALVGYVFHHPALYFFIPGYTTAMAVNTATAFLLLGCVPISHANV